MQELAWVARTKAPPQTAAVASQLPEEKCGYPLVAKLAFFASARMSASECHSTWLISHTSISLKLQLAKHVYTVATFPVAPPLHPFICQSHTELLVQQWRHITCARAVQCHRARVRQPEAQSVGACSRQCLIGLRCMLDLVLNRNERRIARLIRLLSETQQRKRSLSRPRSCNFKKASGRLTQSPGLTSTGV